MLSWKPIPGDRSAHPGWPAYDLEALGRRSPCAPRPSGQSVELPLLIRPFLCMRGAKSHLNMADGLFCSV